MARPHLSIMGMYDYDPRVFDFFRPPAGLDRKAIITEILLECSSFNLVWPDYSTMRQAIKSWSRSNEVRWRKLYETTRMEYNPINNYDRKKEITSNDIMNGTSGGAGTGSVASFNSPNMVNSVGNVAKSNRHEKHNHQTTETESGNIGVTTSQQMIQSERELWEWNIYQMFVDEFKRKFCVMVYA